MNNITPCDIYKFITPDMCITQEKLVYINKILYRQESIININKFLNNLEKSIKIECSILESSIIYNHNKNFNIEFIKPIYIDKLNNILLNIDKLSYLNNTTLLDEINNNLIDCSFIAFLLPHQIHPKKWDFLIKKREKNENNINKDTIE